MAESSFMNREEAERFAKYVKQRDPYKHVEVYNRGKYWYVRHSGKSNYGTYR